MENLKEFQEVARKHGFVCVEETEDGTVLWLTRPTADAEDRMCIDSVTNSVTVFWETRIARQTWSDLGAPRLRDLRSLLLKYKFSVALGEITRIDNRWYVTHSGLLRLG
jgi:hypothetical protein